MFRFLKLALILAASFWRFWLYGCSSDLRSIRTFLVSGISWAKRLSNINVLMLTHWLDATRTLIDKVEVVEFFHVPRTSNLMADILSKRAFLSTPGHIFLGGLVYGFAGCYGQLESSFTLAYGFS